MPSVYTGLSPCAESPRRRTRPETSLFVQMPHPAIFGGPGVALSAMAVNTSSYSSNLESDQPFVKVFLKEFASAVELINGVHMFRGRLNMPLIFYYSVSDVAKRKFPLRASANINSVLFATLLASVARSFGSVGGGWLGFR